MIDAFIHETETGYTGVRNLTRILSIYLEDDELRGIGLWAVNVAVGFSLECVKSHM